MPALKGSLTYARFFVEGDLPDDFRDRFTKSIRRRAMKPLNEGELMGFMGSLGSPAVRLRVEGNSIVSFKATARLRLPNGQLSDLRRTVAAQVKYFQRNSKSSIDVLRWHDSAWSN